MINDQIRAAILDHCQAEAPREACGLIVDDAYIPCKNVHHSPADFFEIDALDFLQCSKLGEVRAIVHSHPDGTTRPSVVDRYSMALHGLPWVITDGVDVDVYQVEDYTPPLLGREYVHGVQDCYTIVRDYYERELGIRLNEYDRNERWWEDKNSDSLYLENFKREGFREVDTIQKHDVILCRIGRTEHINHAVIFIGEGELKSEDTPVTVGDSLILHHPYGRPSVREIYGEQWRNRSALIIRHKSK